MLRISYLRKTKLVKADTPGIMDNMQDTSEDKIGVTTVNIVNTVTPRGGFTSMSTTPAIYGLCSYQHEHQGIFEYSVKGQFL